MAKPQLKDVQDIDPPPVTTSQVGGVTEGDVAAMAAEQIATAPLSTPQVVARAKADTPIDGPRDSAGILFNPQEHERGAGGEPRKTKTGTWAKKRGVRAGSIGSVSGKPADAVVANAPQSLEPKEATKVAGAVAAQMMVTIGMLVGGDEFRPGKSEIMPDVDEQQFLTESWVAYFHAKGVQDLPPGIALSFAMFIYIAPRFNKPRTKERMGGIFLWARNKWRNWRKDRNGPHADKRDNGVRKEHLREATAPPIQEERSEDNHS